MFNAALLFKMSQGPVTHSPVFICILKAEQLLDLAIRENVLKTKLRAQSPERIFDLKAGSSYG